MGTAKDALRSFLDAENWISTRDIYEKIDYDFHNTDRLRQHLRQMHRNWDEIEINKENNMNLYRLKK